MGGWMGEKKLRLSACEWVIYAEIAQRTHNGEVTWVGKLAIAGLSQKTIQTRLERLRGKGVIRFGLARAGAPYFGRQFTLLIKPDQVEARTSQDERATAIREIAAQRKIRGLTQKEAAKEIGVRLGTVAAAEGDAGTVDAFAHAWDRAFPTGASYQAGIAKGQAA